jgi:hypothetical protein
MPNIIGVPKMPGAMVTQRMPIARQVARNRQGHANDAALACRISGLADLTVVGGHAGGVDQHAAFAGGFGRVLAHGLSGQADHVEAADQVDVDHAREGGQRVRAVLAHGLGADGDACAIDQAHQLAAGQRRRHDGLGICFLRHIAAHEDAADLGRQRLTLVGLHIGHHHGGTGGGQHARRAFAQARGAAGDDEDLASDVHGDAPCSTLKPMPPTRAR